MESAGFGGGKNTYVKLGHRSPAGINGFPGNLDITAMISVYENTLTLAYEATTDAPTPISFTWHPYFTLSGDPCRQHRRAAAHDGREPLSTRQRVARAHRRDRAGGRHAVRFPQAEDPAVPPPSSHPQIALTAGYDHCWVIDAGAPIAAELFSPASGVRMRVKTNLPGLQVYGAYHLRPPIRAGTPLYRAGEFSRMRRITRTSRAASSGPARRIDRS